MHLTTYTVEVVDTVKPTRVAAVCVVPIEHRCDTHPTTCRFYPLQEHEFIGSSLLILYDRTGTKGAWMIDFGKTTKVDRPITHMKPWELGNHEDGYLLGLDALIDIFTSSRR